VVRDQAGRGDGSYGGACSTSFLTSGTPPTGESSYEFDHDHGSNHNSRNRNRDFSRRRYRRRQRSESMRDRRRRQSYRQGSRSPPPRRGNDEGGWEQEDKGHAGRSSRYYDGMKGRKRRGEHNRELEEREASSSKHTRIRYRTSSRDRPPRNSAPKEPQRNDVPPVVRDTALERQIQNIIREDAADREKHGLKDADDIVVDSVYKKMHFQVAGLNMSRSAAAKIISRNALIDRSDDDPEDPSNLGGITVPSLIEEQQREGEGPEKDLLEEIEDEMRADENIPPKMKAILDASKQSAHTWTPYFLDPHVNDTDTIENIMKCHALADPRDIISSDSEERAAREL